MDLNRKIYTGTEYVSKEIALLAKERGFKEGTQGYYDEGQLKQRDNDFINYRDITDDLIACPSYQQLIEWLFNCDYLTVSSRPYASIKEQEREWLEFWYNTLIPELIDIRYTKLPLNTQEFNIKNEFVLEGFTGMLLNWFEKNHLYLLIETCGSKSDYPKYTYNLINLQDYKSSLNNKLENVELEYEELIKGNTKQQARHIGILKCFELIKNLNNGN